MQPTHVVGIDPGLVHTGLVRLSFHHHERMVLVDSLAVPGVDLQEIVEFTEHEPHTITFIEGYKPRTVLHTDKRMVEAVAEIRTATRGKVLLNTGVKKVVKEPLMRLLHVWDFTQTTHHQDLRSAGRILLLGMLKDDKLNAIVSRVVKGHLDGRPWDVRG